MCLAKTMFLIILSDLVKKKKKKFNSRFENIVASRNRRTYCKLTSTHVHIFIYICLSCIAECPGLTCYISQLWHHSETESTFWAIICRYVVAQHGHAIPSAPAFDVNLNYFLYDFYCVPINAANNFVSDREIKSLTHEDLRKLFPGHQHDKLKQAIMDLISPKVSSHVWTDVWR